MLLLGAVSAFLAFIDAAFAGLGTRLWHSDAQLVLLGNWIGLAFPALAILASRPLREPLRLQRRAPTAPAATAT